MGLHFIKKTICLKLFICSIITCLLVLNTSTIYANANAQAQGNSPFSDMTSHWANTYVEPLTQRKVINGYPDGTYRPQGTVSVAEFTKILVAALEKKPDPIQAGDHWAQGYMKVALKEQLIFSNEPEFQQLNTPLTRGQLARMLYRALPEPLEFKDLVYHQYMIEDLSDCLPNDRVPILNCFKFGIITGYPDGTFQDKNPVTRAEAATMMMRYLEPTLRIIPELPYAEGVTIVESDEADRYDFYITLNINYNLENQYSSVSKYLNSKINASKVTTLINHIRTKSNEFDEVSPLEIEWINGKIKCFSNIGTYTIIIRGDDGIND